MHLERDFFPTLGGQAENVQGWGLLEANRLGLSSRESQADSSRTKRGQGQSGSHG